MDSNRSDIFEKLHSGELYDPCDSRLAAVQTECLELLYRYNATTPREADKRRELLQKMFAEIGEGCYIEPPLHANWGGKFVKFGKHVYANFNLTLVDDTEITVGDNTKFGPGVIIATAGHPLASDLREQGCQFNRPVRIGNNCWLGAGAIVLPGVTVGDNSIIGAGAVVSRDVPPNSLALGVPAKVVKKLP